LWLAQVGSERLDEIADPEKAIDRAFETYLRKGYSENWINQRIKSMEVRKGINDEFKRAVQKKNGLPQSTELDLYESSDFLNATVEMETGTYIPYS